MKIDINGFGFDISRSFCGGAGCSIQWQWCIGLHWRTPYAKTLGWWDWRSRWFYFGKPHEIGGPFDRQYSVDELADYSKYQNQMNEVFYGKR